MRSSNKHWKKWLRAEVIGPWIVLILFAVIALSGSWPTDDHGRPMKFNKYRGFYSDSPPSAPNPNDGDPLIGKKIAQYPILVEAKTALKSGNYAQAIELFTKAIEIFPEDHEAFYCRGVAYGDLGKLDHACHDFETAVRLNPKSAHSQVGLCMVLMAQGKFERAEVEIAQAERMELPGELASTVRDMRDSLTHED